MNPKENQHMDLPRGAAAKYGPRDYSSLSGVPRRALERRAPLASERGGGDGLDPSALSHSTLKTARQRILASSGSLVWSEIQICLRFGGNPTYCLK